MKLRLGTSRGSKYAFFYHNWCMHGKDHHHGHHLYWAPVTCTFGFLSLLTQPTPRPSRPLPMWARAPLQKGLSLSYLISKIPLCHLASRKRLPCVCVGNSEERGRGWEAQGWCHTYGWVMGSWCSSQYILPLLSLFLFLVLSLIWPRYCNVKDQP